MIRSDDRVVAVLTTGRQDWGILRSVCAAVDAEPGLSLRVVVGGMHLSERHGATVTTVRQDGFEPAASLAWVAHGGTDHAFSEAARALEAVGGWLERADPDVLVLLGDRFETAAAALAATLHGTPIVHLHGGEQTLGAFDDALRHAITKLAHLHLVSSETHRRRVIALGEDPGAVHVIGAPGLDNLVRDDLPGRLELEAAVGVPLAPPVVIVTVHPATLDRDPASVARAVGAAMDQVAATYIVTLPNSDPGSDAVASVMSAAGAADGRAVRRALGERLYWGLLLVADAMLGNSSSGLIEGPAVGLPVVNVGDRQAGRAREGNVLDVGVDADAVAAALRRALDPGFRAAIPAIDRALLDGHAGQRAARIIAAWHPTRPPRKPPIRVQA
jgi:UDP-hydrolysing UDP-N-acetyl-D-glucosamine 2-epimerase